MIRLVCCLKGVLTDVLRLPLTPVPTDVTTYLRYGFRLPNGTDYHLIASTPIINTSQVLHHMILYGCTDDFTDCECVVLNGTEYLI